MQVVSSANGKMMRRCHRRSGCISAVLLAMRWQQGIDGTHRRESRYSGCGILPVRQNALHHRPRQWAFVYQRGAAT
ncbi:hypothetical protein KCP70_01395 [Salmonella enterica subsp. enterica]|nr:hypothetical protein KCP70_01395 [Salmonella enterica subsp. enterica]